MTGDPRFHGLHSGETLREWEGHLPDLVSQEELDRSETACRWCIWALAAFAWALATGGIAAIAGGIWQ